MCEVKCILIGESLVSVVPVTARPKDPHQMLQYSSLSLYSLLVDSQHLHANTEKNAVNVKWPTFSQAICLCMSVWSIPKQKFVFIKRVDKG